MSNKLRLGIPKGSLQDATIALFGRAGWNIYADGRSYFPSIDDPRDRMHADPRAGDGSLRRSRRPRRRIDRHRLGGGKRAGCGKHYQPGLCQAEPAAGAMGAGGSGELALERAEDLEGKIIATELVEVTKRYFAQKRVPVKVEFSWGATEVKPPTLADAIVEVTETGSSLTGQSLRIIDTVMESETRLIANRSACADPWKRRKWTTLALMLRGAIDAQVASGPDAERGEGKPRRMF